MIFVNDYEDKFKKYLSMALLIHVFIFLSLYLGSHLGFSIFENKSNLKTIELIKTAVRVDLVEMPKYTVQELKIMKIAPPIEDEPQEKIKEVKAKSNETSKVEFKKAGKKIDLSSLLKKLSKKKEIKKIKRIKRKNRYNNKNIRNLILEGNKISKGSSIIGEMVDISQEVFVSYIQSLPGSVKPNWKLPSYLFEQELNCRIKIYITGTGRLIRAVIFQTSGSDEFDSLAMKAVKKSSPFPTPAKEIWSRVASGEVVLGFPL